MIKCRAQFILTALVVTFSVNFSVLADSNCEAIQTPAGVFSTTPAVIQGGNTPSRLNYFTLKCLAELSGDKSFSEGLASSAPATRECETIRCINYH